MSAIYYKGKKYTGPTLDLGSGSLTTNNKTIVGGINEINSSLENKQNTLVSGTNIKTINNESILGSGNIAINVSIPVATTSANGLMSSTDKVAVDKIGTGTLNTTNKNIIAAVNELNSLIVNGDVNTYTTASVSVSGSSSSQRVTFSTSSNPANKGFLIIPTNLATFNTSSQYVDSGGDKCLFNYSLGDGNVSGGFCYGTGYSSSYGSSTSIRSGMTYSYSSSTVTCQGTYGVISYGSHKPSYTAYIPTKYQIMDVSNNYSSGSTGSVISFQLSRKPVIFVVVLNMFELSGISSATGYTYGNAYGMLIGTPSGCTFYLSAKYSSEYVYFPYSCAISTNWLQSSNEFNISIGSYTVANDGYARLIGI